MIDYCDRCSEPFDEDTGDGATCVLCGRCLCELHFGSSAEENAASGPVCGRCRKKEGKVQA